MATQAKVDQVGKRPLPLPRAPPLVADDSELCRSWSSVNLLFAEYLRATDQKAKESALRDFGVYILLACQVILRRLKDLSIQHDDSSPDNPIIFTLIKLVFDAATWLKANPVIEEKFRWEPKTRKSLVFLLFLLFRPCVLTYVDKECPWLLPFSNGAALIVSRTPEIFPPRACSVTRRPIMHLIEHGKC